MVKIYTKSDYHLEDHLTKTNPAERKKEIRKLVEEQMALSKIDKKKRKENVFIIAGDITSNEKDLYQFLTNVGYYGEHVYYVLGNHDYYTDDSVEEKVERIRAWSTKAKGITLLENFERHVIEGTPYTIAGDTLWYSLNEYYEKRVFSQMADMEYVGEAYIQAGYKRGMQAYRDMEGVDIIVTHVPPIITNTNHRKGIACYCHSLKDLKARQHWISGHTHENEEYEKANITITVDVYGYALENRPKAFHPIALK